MEAKRIKEKSWTTKRAHKTVFKPVLEYELVTNKTVDGFKMMRNGFYIFLQIYKIMNQSY